MGGLLPLRSSVSKEPENQLHLVEIDDEAADEVFAALSSSTTREILSALYDKPHTASDLSGDIDISLQNAKYHLEKLLDADLIEIAGTWYSEHGQEMKVYAPTNESLVIFATDESTRSSLQNGVKRIIGAVGLLGLVSLIINRVIQMFQESSMEDPNLSVKITGEMGDAAGSGIFLSPGAIFFIGGLFILFLASIHWYRIHYRS